MARIRSVHPGLFTDEAFVSLSYPARLLLIGLWTEADDHGVFEWKPVTIKMRIFPADSLDVVPLLDELAAQNTVHKYGAGGGIYGAIRNFCRWQRPTRPTYRCPLPDDCLAYVGAAKISESEPPEADYSLSDHGSLTECSLSDHRALTEHSVNCRSEGEERRVGEKIKSVCAEPAESADSTPPDPPSPTVLTFPTIGTGPKTWDLTEADLGELQADFPSLDVRAHCRHAHAWIRGTPSRRKTARGMRRFLVSWLGRETNRWQRPQARDSPADGRAAIDHLREQTRALLADDDSATGAHG